MTYKQFDKWCNERAVDGCWGRAEATLCIGLLRAIKKRPFWRREKIWKRFEDEVVSEIIEPTNQKIKELTGREVE